MPEITITISPKDLETLKVISPSQELAVTAGERLAKALKVYRSIHPDITAASGSLYDGDHGMTELYEHRIMLFCVLLNSFPVLAWKTRKHHDGSSYPGYFLAGMELPAGTISYHLPDKCWDLLNVSGKEFGPEWDGHTSDDVLKRLEETARTGNLWTLMDSTAPEKPAANKCDCYPDPQNWLKCQYCGNPMFNEDLIDFKSYLLARDLKLREWQEKAAGILLSAISEAEADTETGEMFLACLYRMSCVMQIDTSSNPDFRKYTSENGCSVPDWQVRAAHEFFPVIPWKNINSPGKTFLLSNLLDFWRQRG